LKKTFLANLALLVVLNLLVKPFWIFGIDRGVQNLVGADDYGLYFALLNFSFLFSIFLDFGITNFNNRNLAQHSQLLEKHFSKLLSLKFLLALVYALGMALLAWGIGYKRQEWGLLGLLGLNQVLVSLILFLRSNLSGLHLFRADSLVSVMDRVLMILFCGAMLWGPFRVEVFRVEWFVWTQTLAYALTALLALGLVLRRSGRLRLHWDWPFFLAIARRSLPFALLVLLMGLYGRVDSVMLERLHPRGSLEVGIYAHSFRILDAASMFAYLFASLLLPIFSRMLQRGEPVGALLRFSAFMLLVPAVILVAVSFYFRHAIIGLLYTEHLDESAEVFGLLMLSFVPISVGYTFGTLLTANGSLRLLNGLALASLAANVGLNLWLIPRWGAWGAALSSVLTQSFSAAGQFWLAKRVFGFRVRPALALATAAFVLGVWALAWLARAHASNWLMAVLAVGILGLDLAFLARLVNLRDLRLLMASPKPGEADA